MSQTEFSLLVEPTVSRKSERGYCKPVLIFYGDVRDITLGGSGTIFESGPYGPDGCKLNGQTNRDCLS